MQQQNKNRGQQQHGQDQGQMPNRNRTGVEDAPERDTGNQRPGPSQRRDQEENDVEQEQEDVTDPSQEDRSQSGRLRRP